jgi:hypothetical protein
MKPVEMLRKELESKEGQKSALDREIAELRHAISLLSGEPVRVQVAVKPDVRKKPTQDHGTPIGYHTFPSGKRIPIYRPVMVDVMEILSQQADDAWFSSLVFLPAIQKHYGTVKTGGFIKDTVGSYLKFLVSKGILEHNGKARRHSRYRKTEKVRRDTPGAEDIARRISEERQLLREVQSR